MSLLDKAKAYKARARHAKISTEEIEVGLAWLNDEIGTNQVKHAIGKNAYAVLAVILRAAFREGSLVITKE